MDEPNTGGNNSWLLFNVENHPCPSGGNHRRINVEIRCKCGGCGEWFADLSREIRAGIEPTKHPRGPKPSEALASCVA